MSSSYVDVMSEFSQSNAKIMATALFFEYVVYCVFAFADGYFKSGPEYIYVNEKMSAMMKEKNAKNAQEKNAKNAQAKAAKEAQKKQNNDQKSNKKEDKKEDKKKEDKKEDKKGPNVQKEGGEMEYDGGDEERGRVNTGPKASSKTPEIPGNQRVVPPPANARERTPSNREMGREIDRKAALDPALDEVGYDYLKWSRKNNDSISKIIVTTFPKYFLFFAFCVGYCASRAPTDWAVGLTYSMVLVRIVHVYSYYYYNQILIIGCVGFGAAINITLIFTALINKY